MKRYLEKLRNRPDDEKKRFVTTLASISTGIIVIIWLIVLSLGGNDEVAPEPSPQIESSFINALDAIFDNSSDEFGELSSDFDAANEAFNFENYAQGEIDPSDEEPDVEQGSTAETGENEVINETQTYEE